MAKKYGKYEFYVKCWFVHYDFFTSSEKLPKSTFQMISFTPNINHTPPECYHNFFPKITLSDHACTYTYVQLYKSKTKFHTRLKNNNKAF